MNSKNSKAVDAAKYWKEHSLMSDGPDYESEAHKSDINILSDDEEESRANAFKQKVKPAFGWANKETGGRKNLNKNSGMKTRNRSSNLAKNQEER